MALLTQGRFSKFFFSLLFSLSNLKQTLKMTPLKNFRTNRSKSVTKIVCNMLELYKGLSPEFSVCMRSQFISWCHQPNLSKCFEKLIFPISRSLQKQENFLETPRGFLAITNPVQQKERRVGEVSLCWPSKISSHHSLGLLCQSSFVPGWQQKDFTSLSQIMAKY